MDEIGQFDAVLYADLLVDTVNVVLYRVLGNIKKIGDLIGFLSLDKQMNDLLLALRNIIGFKKDTQVCFIQLLGCFLLV